MTPRQAATKRATKAAASRKRRADPLVKVEQQRVVVRMWRAGASMVEIADELGLSHETIRRIRREALDAAVEDRDTEVKLAKETELQRLDALMSAHWQRAYGIPFPAFDEDGEKLPLDLRLASDDAAKIVLKCIDLRAKLLGLYAPIKVDAKVRTELDAQIEALLEELEDSGLAVRE